MNNTKIKLQTIRKILIISFLLMVLGFFVYANALKGNFIWDDLALVQNNMAIRNLSNIPSLFKQDLGGNYKFYRPLSMAIYAIEYSFSGLNIQIYHFTNIFIHILVSLSICFLVYLLFCNQIVALLCGLLFLIHPVHTEAVTYISGLADPLGAFFIIWSFIFYIEYLKSTNKLFYSFILISYVLALLSKEASLIFPIVLLLYHYSFKVKFKSKQFLPILCLSLIYLFFRFSFLKPVLPNTEIMQWSFLPKRILGFFVAIVNYIKILFIPFDLHMEYGNKLFNFFNFRVIIGIMFSGVLLIYAFLKRNKNTVFFFSVLWFFITLLPYSNIYPINAFMAEHWLYLPSIGFFIIISKCLVDLYTSKKKRILAAILILTLSMAYSYLTIKQNNYWKDPVTFYVRALKYAPWSARIYNNLGCVYDRYGKYDQSVQMFKKAVNIDPNYGEAQLNLAQAYFDAKQYQQSIRYCEEALKLNVKNAQCLMELLKPYKVK